MGFVLLILDVRDICSQPLRQYCIQTYPFNCTIIQHIYSFLKVKHEKCSAEISVFFALLDGGLPYDVL